MLQIKNLTLTHKKDLREILGDFSCVFNNGDKAVIIGEEGNGKSTLLKWLYDPFMVEDYCEAHTHNPTPNKHAKSTGNKRKSCQKKISKKVSMNFFRNKKVSGIRHRRN